MRFSKWLLIKCGFNRILTRYIGDFLNIFTLMAIFFVTMNLLLTIENVLKNHYVDQRTWVEKPLCWPKNMYWKTKANIYIFLKKLELCIFFLRKENYITIKHSKNIILSPSLCSITKSQIGSCTLSNVT